MLARIAPLLLVLLAAPIHGQDQPEPQPKPLRVFVLLGQSNMVGFGRISLPGKQGTLELDVPGGGGWRSAARWWDYSRRATSRPRNVGSPFRDRAARRSCQRTSSRVRSSQTRSRPSRSSQRTNVKSKADQLGCR